VVVGDAIEVVVDDERGDGEEVTAWATGVR
jgi:hypothetical protein